MTRVVFDPANRTESQKELFEIHSSSTFWVGGHS